MAVHPAGLAQVGEAAGTFHVLADLPQVAEEADTFHVLVDLPQAAEEADMSLAPLAQVGRPRVAAGVDQDAPAAASDRVGPVVE